VTEDVRRNGVCIDGRRLFKAKATRTRRERTRVRERDYCERTSITGGSRAVPGVQ
jgi:hypothetical protein